MKIAVGMLGIFEPSSIIKIMNSIKKGWWFKKGEGLRVDIPEFEQNCMALYIIV
jgi:hypothetical protein